MYMCPKEHQTSASMLVLQIQMDKTQTTDINIHNNERRIHAGVVYYVVVRNNEHILTA